MQPRSGPRHACIQPADAGGAGYGRPLVKRQFVSPTWVLEPCVTRHRDTARALLGRPWHSPRMGTRWCCGSLRPYYRAEPRASPASRSAADRRPADIVTTMAAITSGLAKALPPRVRGFNQQLIRIPLAVASRERPYSKAPASIKCHISNMIIDFFAFMP